MHVQGRSDDAGGDVLSSCDEDQYAQMWRGDEVVLLSIPVDMADAEGVDRARGRALKP